MTREEKDQLIDELVESFNTYEFIYVTDSSDLTANSNNDLRRVLHKNGVKMQVAKNTLIRQALVRAEKDWGDLTDTLKGTTALLFASNPKAPAIAIKDFRKKSEKPILKGAYLDSSVYIGDDQLEVLINYKSKEDLIGEIIGLLQSPAKNVISALRSGGSNLAGILQTLSEKEN
ncbi:MAG: 50S ribosomal protein L10 [Flavobacteriales bacterium]|nr:50S ribosomal protein L10 [Bacteroidota bacterium]MCB9240080.1 50S ribosomal protein L10 [Flavobacteriales bacterium]